jgi:hypothetical protein
MSGYRAAIDFGTSYTVAASLSSAQAAPVVVPLADEGRLSSAVALDDSGELRAGPLAEQVAALTPDRVERTPKRCLDQPDVMLGRRPIKTVDLVAAVLVYVQDELHLHFNGCDAEEVVLTHPARWEPGDPRMKRLGEAAQQVGLESVRFLPEPCAAALALAANGQLEVSEGDLIAVYDLGGGTFDTALLNCGPGGSFALVGEPGGDQELGGEWLDDRLAERLSGQLPPEDEANLRDPDSSPDPRRWRRAGAAFRQEMRKAKERLAREVTISIPLNPPFSLEQISLSRAELERTAIPLITKSADRFELFLQRNGKTPEDLAAICLVGGSSRLTIVNRILGSRFGRPLCTHGDPKAVTAVGALFDLPSPTAHTVRPSPEASGAERMPDRIVPAASGENTEQPVTPGEPEIEMSPGQVLTTSDPSGPLPPEVVEETTSPATAQVTTPPVAPPAPPPEPTPRRDPAPRSSSETVTETASTGSPPVIAPPVALTGFAVRAHDLQSSSPLMGTVVVERINVSEGTWVKIGDPLFQLGTPGGLVTLWSTFIGQIEALGVRNGEPLTPDRPLLRLTVSAWLFRMGVRMPFDTGVMLASGVPAKNLDPTGTASRLMVTVDSVGCRPVPWRTSCLLYVPKGRHLISATYEQPGASFGTVSMSVKIRPGKQASLTYQPPWAVGGSGTMRS